MDTKDRLAIARKNKKMTQQQVADLLEMTLQGYQNYEYGKTRLNDRSIIKLCTILTCSPSWLLGMNDSGEQLTEDSELLKRLKESFEALSEEGQQKVVEYTNDLAALKKYSAKSKSTDVQDVGVSGVA